MVHQSITLKGIEQAIGSLKYRNPHSPKYKLVHFIRSCYRAEEDVARLQAIDLDRLVRAIWEVGDAPALLRAKRKNFHSLKSAVNNDLIELYEKGENTEGIIIGPENTFALSDRAKDNLLSSLADVFREKGSLSLTEIGEVLNAISEMLQDLNISDQDLKENVTRLKEALQSLSPDDDLEVVEMEVEEAAAGGGEPAGGDLEEIDEEELEGLEEADAGDELDGVEAAEDLPETDALEAPDEAESPENGEGEGDEGGEVVEVEVEEAAAGGGEPAGGDLEEIDEEELEGLEEADAGDELDGVEAAEDLPETDALEAEADGSGDESDAFPDGDDEAEIIELMEDADGADEPEAVETEAPELGLPFEADEGEFSLPEKEKNRLLSERFDGYLGAMDRYYNQYLLVPAGDYPIGKENGERQASGPGTVSLSPFYMGKYPVTNALFEIFVDRTGYKTTAEKQGYSEVYFGRFCKTKDKNSGLLKAFWKATLTRKKVDGACWYQPFGPGSTLHGKRNHPVVQVSFRDAAAFAAWIGKRLPTEAEWEAAARTAQGHLYPWGEESRPSRCNVEASAIADTTPVDHYPAGENALGFADLQGNVMEWTLDRMDQPEGACHVVKGGSWISGMDIDLSFRSLVRPDTASNILGFRCVAE